MLSRPKHPTVYPVVSGWYTNTGQIHYIAHAITAAGAAFPLGNTIASAAGGGPTNHPDQQFWRQGGFVNRIAAAGGAAAILRIEIDCTLLPCAAGPNCCLHQVPRLIAGIGLVGKPLRIFSHRDEGMGGPGTTTKRYFACNSSHGVAQLNAALAAHDGWHWAPWAGVYP